MPSERSRKRSRSDMERDYSRKTKKKKRSRRSRSDKDKKRAESVDIVFSGAEDEATNGKSKSSKSHKKSSKSEKPSSKSKPKELKSIQEGEQEKEAEATNGKTEPAKSKSELAAEEDFMLDLVRSDHESEPGDDPGTPPPSPGSRYQGSPSPPPPMPKRKPRQFVIDYKGTVPTHDPGRRIIGLTDKKEKKKKKTAAPAGDVASPLANLTGDDDRDADGSKKVPNPKALRNLALAKVNALRNKFSSNDFHKSLASLERSLEQNKDTTATAAAWKAKEEKPQQTFDSRLVFKPAGKRRKRKTALQLVDQGTFIAEARIIRREAAEKELSNKVKAKAHKKRKSEEGDEDEEASEMTKVLNELPPVPLVEWWDKALLARPEMGYESAVSTQRVTSHVDHPEVMRPDRLKPVNIPLPFYLTKQERRKKRRQIRKQKHETLTDEIRLGLREPPEPKLNLENIIRVLGSQAIQDPTSAEAKARASMLKRKMEHELHNEKRRLTGAQKREKKKQKLLEDTSREVHVALYRVSDLSDGKKRYKVDINASQYNLTGRCIRIKGQNLNMVVVEGGPKGIAKYDRLMTRRIRWGDDLMNSSEASTAQHCAKVWQGVNRKRNFKEFQMKLFHNTEDARKHLDEQGGAHYWDQIENFNVKETF